MRRRQWLARSAFGVGAVGARPVKQTRKREAGSSHGRSARQRDGRRDEAKWGERKPDVRDADGSESLNGASATQRNGVHIS